MQGPIYSKQKPNQTPKDDITKPLSLEMFNGPVSDLNMRGIINLKKYNCYLVKKTSKPV